MDFIVEGGGDTLVSGSKNGKPWMVGIQDPEGRGALGAIAAHDEAIVTSGNYLRMFEYEGIPYSHIIHPKTGWPLPHDKSPKSVTIVGKNATDADAYCTAVNVMGVSKGMAFVESQADLEVLFVTAQGEIVMSSGLKERFQPLLKAKKSNVPKEMKR